MHSITTVDMLLDIIYSRTPACRTEKKAGRRNILRRPVPLLS